MSTSSLGSIAELVHRAQSILVISHVFPDGDTIGSALGLSWALRSLGKQVSLACSDPVPDRLAFLPGSDGFAVRGHSDEDLIIVVDCSDLQRVGSIYDADAFASVPVVNIDHHVTNTMFGNVQYVEERAATAELVLEIVNHLQVAINPTIASCLLTGITTDTRGFRTNNTTPVVMDSAVVLMRAGASLPDITDAVFNHRPISLLRLWGPVFANAELHDGILWAAIDQELYESTKSTYADSNGLVNFMSTIDEARVAVLLRGMGNSTVDVSMRSRPGVDVSKVAFSLGGGGHPRASGCQVHGSMSEARDQVLAALQAEMQNSDALG